MSRISHYLLFVGATPSLAQELLKIHRAYQAVDVLAPAQKKGERGVTDAAIENCLTILFQRLSALAPEQHRQPQRLTVWSYEQADHVGEPIKLLSEKLGSLAWIEPVPAKLARNDVGTRSYIESKLREIESMINEVVVQTNSKRKTSPFSLPMKNFQLDQLSVLKQGWPRRGASVTDLKDQIKRFNAIFMLRKSAKCCGHVDQRNLLFRAAEDGALHGKPHPTGTEHAASFIAGRFRFGASLYPGFHYDVSLTGKGRKIEIISCDGRSRWLTLADTHINIFPNDYIL